MFRAKAKFDFALRVISEAADTASVNESPVTGRDRPQREKRWAY